MKHTREIAHIRQLCCLGLGGEAIMPSLFKAIQKLVPSSTQTFFWLDAHGMIENAYQEPFTPELSELYLTEFYGKRELEAWPGIQKMAVMPTAEVGRCLEIPGIDRTRFYRSDFYNLYLRLRDSHDPIYIRIRDVNRVAGLAIIGRRSKDPPFSRKELDLVDTLRSYIGHGLIRSDTGKILYADSDETGLVIVRPDCKIVYASPRAKELLYYATFPHAPHRNGQVYRDIQIPSPMKQLVNNLAGTFNGQEVLPPVLHHQNPWGKFVFRAYYLEQPDFEICELAHQRSKNSLVGIVIQFQEPFPLKLLRNMQDLPLSPREKEVCLLIAEGLSHPEIGNRLTITVTTVKSLVESVYVKLGVTGHAALVKRLMMN